MVTPQPALEFARRIGAETLELGNDCGHLAVGCDRDRSNETIREFLAR